MTSSSPSRTIALVVALLIAPCVGWPDETPPVGSLAPPQLIGSQQAYNLVQYAGSFFGVPRYLGDVDIADPVQREDPRILRSSDLPELQRMIDDHPISLWKRLLAKLGLWSG